MFQIFFIANIYDDRLNGLYNLYQIFINLISSKYMLIYLYIKLSNQMLDF